MKKKRWDFPKNLIIISYPMQKKKWNEERANIRCIFETLFQRWRWQRFPSLICWLRTEHCWWCNPPHGTVRIYPFPLVEEGAINGNEKMRMTKGNWCEKDGMGEENNEILERGFNRVRRRTMIGYYNNTLGFYWIYLGKLRGFIDWFISSQPHTFTYLSF